MNTVCEVCGDIGVEHLLLCCSGCKGSATHQYCLDKVLYDASLEDWFCNQCCQRNSEDNYTRSLGKLSSERLSSHVHFGSTSEQPITKSVESARVVGPWGPQKSKSNMAKSACQKETNSFQKKSNMGGKGIKKRRGNAAGVACTSGKALLHPCQTIGTEIAKNNKDGNRQVDNENSVQTLNNDHPSLKAKGSPNPWLALECNRTAQSDLESNIRKFPFSVREVAVNQVPGLKDDSAATLSPKHTDNDKQSNEHDAVVKNIKVKSGKDNINVVHEHQNKYWARNKDKPAAHGDGNSNVLDDLTLEREKKEIRFQLYHEASNELQRRSMAANIPQPSTKQNDALDKAISDSSNLGVLPKENNCLPSMRIENHNMKECHSGPSKLLDRTYSSSSLAISSKAKSVPEASSTEVEISDAVQNFVKDIPRKRRRLILLYDDDDDENKEEKAEDVQQENIDPQPHKCDEPTTKLRIDSENYVEEAVWTGDSNDENLMNGRPVKRRCIVENEDEGDTVGATNAESVLNDATNWCLNGGAKMVSQTSIATDHQTSIATDHLLQSRPSDSESVYQQYCIYSQPLDEPIWSGVFKIDTEVFLKLDAHLSTKACQRVWELSRLLQPVVEVMKLPRSQAWPKSWTSSGPTDGSIGLFFFPHSSRQNDVSNRLVNRIIKSDCALKVVVGITELLIFHSLLLPKQYHFFQGKQYLWGVFRPGKCLLDGGVQAKEQDGSVHAVEEGKQEQDLLDQQQDLLDQQADILYESLDQETPHMKHCVHFENQQVECNSKAQEAMKVATGEGISSPVSSPKAGSNCFVQTRIETKLHALGDVDPHEDFTSSTEWNASCATERSGDSGPPAVATKLIKHADHGHRQPPSSSEPHTTKLFGFVATRTPRAQQLIQEMASEGALLFPVAEEMVAADSTTGSSTGIVYELNTDVDCLHVREPPQTFDFVSMGHGEPGVDSEACLELFPVREEQIGWAPRVEVSGEVDLNLSIGKQSQAPSLPPLF